MKGLLLLLLLGSLATNYYLWQKLTSPSVPSPKPTRSSVQQQDTNRQITSPVEQVLKASEEQQFAVAIEAYGQLSEDAQQEVKVRWLSLLQNWLDVLNLDAAEALLAQVLLKEPYHVEFLLLEARRLQIVGEHLAALELYLSLYDQRMPVQLQAKVSAALRSLGLQQLAHWEDQQRWSDIEGLAFELAGIIPGERQIRLLLAKSYAHQGALGLMESTLLEVPNLTSQEQNYFAPFRQATEPEAPVNQGTDEQGEGVRLARSGEHFVVTAYLNDRLPLNLLIDTGASTTTLDAEVFDNLSRTEDAKYLGTTQLATAGGNVEGEVYSIEALAIGNQLVEDFKVVVLPLDGLRADGLLGMNFLRHFRFRIDQENQVLFLTSRNR